MHRLLRLIMVFGLCLGFVGAMQPIARAQEAAGTAVDILGADGGVLATVTVDGIEEPFEDYDSGYDPDRGMHYALVTITVSNDGDDDFLFDGYAVKAVDSDGFISQPAWVSRSQSAAAADFDGSPIAPGESFTGAVVFSVFDDSTLDLVFYQPSFSRMVVLSEQAEAIAAPGDAVETLTSDGNEGLIVTVDDFVEVTEGIYPGYEAQRGYSYVQAIVTVENPTDRPIDLDPGMFGLVDDEGYYLSSTSIYFEETPEIAELGYDAVPDGETTTAAISFQVYNEAGVARLVFGPSYFEQLFTVALFDEALRGPIAPAGAPAGGGGGRGAAGADVDPACADVAEWMTWSDELLTDWSDELDAADLPDDVNAADPEVVRDLADATRDVIDEIDANPAPDLAADYEDATVEMLEAFADGLDDIADAIENGEDAAATFTDLEDEIGLLAEDVGTEAEALGTACGL